MEAPNTYSNTKEDTLVMNDNSKYNSPDNSTDKSKDTSSFCEIFFMVCAVLLGAFIIVGSVVWFVYGIIFLVNDYHIADDCSGSNLWAYVLVAIILYWQKVNAKNIGDEESFGILICSAIVDFSLAIWGATELFDKADGCDELTNSNLWKFGLATFIIQIIFGSLIILIPVSICLISKYSVSISVSEPSPVKNYM